MSVSVHFSDSSQSPRFLLYSVSQVRHRVCLELHTYCPYFPQSHGPVPRSTCWTYGWRRRFKQQSGACSNSWTSCAHLHKRSYQNMKPRASFRLSVLFHHVISWSTTVIVIISIRRDSWSSLFLWHIHSTIFSSYRFHPISFV